MNNKVRKIKHDDQPERESAAEGPTTYLARLQALGPRGEPWVTDGLAKRKPVKARSLVALYPSLVGREVLVCAAQPEGTPVIVGFLHEPDLAAKENAPATSVDLVVDRERIVLSARQEVVLRCGQGSITLTADGKVTVRGADVVSTANRTNRIRGGAVRIN